jgi:hypothetical protein
LPTPTIDLKPMFTPIPITTSSTMEGARPLLAIAGYALVAAVLGILAVLLWQKQSA